MSINNQVRHPMNTIINQLISIKEYCDTAGFDDWAYGMLKHWLARMVFCHGLVKSAYIIDERFDPGLKLLVELFLYNYNEDPKLVNIANDMIKLELIDEHTLRGD